MTRCFASRLKPAAVLLAGCIALAGNASADRVPLADIAQWHHERFDGQTVFDWRSGTRTLCMRSDDSASARVWQPDPPLALDRTLSWRWRAETTIDGVDQTVASGDDFAGRVYVAVRHPILFWRSRVLTYVHAGDLAVDTHWPSPFTDRFHIWVVSRGSDAEWHSIERRVAADWRIAFGDEPARFHAIGLMSDSDNTGQNTALCLADLELSDK